MDFTREPVVESVVTPKEGCKLVVRSSKTSGQEEYFVDAVEVVCFGEAVFFRSLERPKSFLVPVTDYEIVEVRETRMVLKTSSGEKGAIKIGGGRVEKAESEKESKKSETRVEKKRRRGSRRRKAREEREEETVEETPQEESTEIEHEEKMVIEGSPAMVSPSLTSLLPPPKTLIRETISRYKEDDLFKEAFYTPDQEEDDDEEPVLFEEEGPSEEEQTWPDQDLPTEEQNWSEGQSQEEPTWSPEPEETSEEPENQNLEAEATEDINTP